MPASRKKSHSKRPVKYSSLIDDGKKLQYFKSHLQAPVQRISVNGKEIRVGDCVTIDIIEDDSGASTAGDACIAQIHELRAVDSKNTETYALVRWFYTGPMLHRLSKPIACIKDLPSSTFSPRELVLSDHSQVFPSTQILDKAVVRVFNESIAEQPEVAPGEWWYRYFWPTKQKRFLTAGHTNLPQPHCAMMTACVKKGYTPHSGLQHYCPRNSCRRWYHHACLSGRVFQPNPNDTNERLILMLRGTPGFEWIELTEDGPDTKFFEHLKLCLDFIKGIVACAQHGVMRGKGYGVVGNINAVKRARELLVEARVSDLWPSDAEIKEFTKWKFPEGQMYRCEGCGGPI